MGDLVRAPGERDPEGFQEYIGAFSSELPSGGSIALREMWYHLRANQTATETALRSVGWKASETLHQRRGFERAWSADEWWRLAGRPYFRLLPGVVSPGDEDGGEWTFDPEHTPTVEAPTDPVTPSVERAKQLAYDLDTRGALVEVHGEPVVPAASTRSGRALHRMYEYLLEHGTAQSADLRGFYEPNENLRSDQGHYTAPAAWFRDVGRSLFAELPGVEPPRMAGQPWTFVGVDEEHAGDGEREQDGAEAVQEALAAVEVPGREPWTDRRREALATLYEHVVDHGPGGVAELLERVDAGYLGYTSPRAFWDEFAGSALCDLPGVFTTEDDGETVVNTEG